MIKETFTTSIPVDPGNQTGSFKIPLPTPKKNQVNPPKQG